MKKTACLLGDPVSHSISPLMHNTAFKLLGLDYTYTCFQVNENTLGAAVARLRKEQVLGFNLTMPNKVKVLEYLDELTPAARLIGAVNTVENRDGHLIGHNTDGIGFLRSVRENGISVKGNTLTLLGIGGAASAICTQAALDGAGNIHVFARLGSRRLPAMKALIEKLRTETSCRFLLHDLEQKDVLRSCLAESVLLIQATSVGMEPFCEDCLIPSPDFLPSGLAVGDVIYSPPKTRLLKMAEEQGCRCFNGHSMLLYQGAEAFRIWTGQDMPVEQIRTVLFPPISAM